MSAAYLPFKELVEVLGEVDAIRLCAGLGGTRVYVPAIASERSRLVEVLGLEAAQRLADHVATGVGGLSVLLPRGPTSAYADHRRALSLAVADPNLSAAEIARKLRTTERSVFRMRASTKTKNRKRRKQPDLFGGR